VLRESWRRVDWECPVRLLQSKGKVRRIWWGWDSEALPQNGKPVLFCAVSEDGDQYYSADPLKVLAEVCRHGPADVFVWNLTYEIGALFRALKVTKEQLAQIKNSSDWVSLKPYHSNISVKVYPARYLGIKWGKRKVNFYDAFAFYQCSLDRAAKKFLGQSKLAFDIERLTQESLEKYWDYLVQYCLEDARLTLALMLRLRAIAQELGFKPVSHYSPAAWAQQMVAQLEGVENVKPLWDLGPEGKRVLEFAWDAYRGGKFEMTVLGYVQQAYMYDINSAYASVIRSLYSLNGARIVRTHLDCPDADYALILCRIYIPPHRYRPHPVGIVWHGVLIFPAGRFLAVITKDEYEFLQRIGAQIDIIDAYWIYTTRKEIYKNVVDRLYDAKMFHPDKNVRDFAKILLNGFYGKMVQTVERPDGKLEPGMAWHPIHAGVITARIRCLISEVQGQPGVLAVHTDSVIADRPLDLPLGEGLGQWKLVAQGPYLGLREGIYQVGDHIAHQGCPGVTDWFAVLRKCDANQTVVLTRRRFKTWKEVHDIEDCNRIVEERLELNFGKLRKRWASGEITAERLLQERIETQPLIVWTQEVQRATNLFEVEEERGDEG